VEAEEVQRNDGMNESKAVAVTSTERADRLVETHFIITMRCKSGAN
jgi:hypothetical protein